MSTMVIAVGLVCGGMGVYVMAMVRVLAKKVVCPACGAKKVSLKSLTRGTEWPPAGGQPADWSLHRCEACGIELCRAGDGPLIPKTAWDAGAREPVPGATVVPPRRR